MGTECKCYLHINSINFYYYDIITIFNINSKSGFVQLYLIALD